MEEQKRPSKALAPGLREEMVRIAQTEGTLTPISVVEHARSPESPLHRYFEWDDTAAAENFRLLQAGFLIRRVRVTITPANDAPPVTVRAFVSLDSDRRLGNGYRQTVEVMADPAMASELLAGAMAELGAFRKKYARLSELSGVMREIDRLAAAADAAAE